MRNIWAFIKWQVSRSTATVTDKLWLIGAFFIGSGAYDAIVHRDQGVPSQLYIGFSFWFLVILKWIIWDGTKYQWERFKKERTELFEKIKGETK